jgi:hypothetical protein
MFCHYPASAAAPLCYKYGLAVVGGRSWGRSLCAVSGHSRPRPGTGKFDPKRPSRALLDDLVGAA